MKRKMYVLTVMTLAAFTICSCGKNAENATEENTQIANPWVECSLDDLNGYFDGMVFPDEDDVQDLICRYDENEGIGESDYTLASDPGKLEFTFRMKKTDGLEDISGCYYEWTSTDDEEILTFPEEFMMYMDDDLTVEVLNWFDTDTNICYSLSLQSDEDLDGFDIYGKAMEMYLTDDQSGQDSTGIDDDAENNETADQEASEAMTIEPLPSGIDLNDLNDCTVAASFTADDFNWMGGNLKVDVYSVLLYDAVDVAGLKAGDSIDVDGTVTEIRTITDNDMGRTINEGEADEIVLTPGEGGTYTIWGYDDTNAMADLGQTEVILSQDVVLHDCGEMPTDDMTDISADNIKTYLEEAKEYKKNFSCYDTEIVIENGEVTEITRSWRP